METDDGYLQSFSIRDGSGYFKESLDFGMIGVWLRKNTGVSTKALSFPLNTKL